MSLMKYFESKSLETDEPESSVNKKKKLKREIVIRDTINKLDF